MNKAELKYISILTVGFLTTFTACKNIPENPNIVWLIAEDLSPDLGCYGNSLVSTPNIETTICQRLRPTMRYSTFGIIS